MLGAVGLNLKDLFSCKHTSNVFAKVARKDPGHKMQLVGGLRKPDELLQQQRQLPAPKPVSCRWLRCQRASLIVGDGLDEADGEVESRSAHVPESAGRIIFPVKG